MRVLVTGGAGYIGSHCVRELERAGVYTVVVDNLSTGNRQAVKKSPLVEADIRDREVIRSTLKEHKIDSVIHFAANSLVGESVTQPLKYYENNVHATQVLLESMIDCGVKHLVFSSTAATYGEPQNTPILESDPTIPKNPYGESKLAIEKMIHWCAEAHGLKYSILRYFNAAGADIDGDIGEDHDPETHLIPLILYAAQGRRDSISIFGQDYATKDGTCVRDYIHVTDLSQAHIKALEYMEKGGQSDIYNLGNGQGQSIREVIDLAKKVSGIDFPVKEAERRAGDPAVLIASSEKAQKQLKWQAQYADLEKIIASAWKWHKAKPQGYAG